MTYMACIEARLISTGYCCREIAAADSHVDLPDIEHVGCVWGKRFWFTSWSLPNSMNLAYSTS